MAKRKEIKWRREGRGTMTGRQDGIIFSDFPAVGRTGTGPHRKLLRHKRGRERDKHGGIPGIYLGGGSGVLPEDRGR